MDDGDVLGRISELVEREHRLRTAHESGSLTAATELEELARAEVELDQCWDLLRQRRAKREYAEDPQEARARPASVVEGYLQ